MAIEDEIALLTHLELVNYYFCSVTPTVFDYILNFYHIFPQTQSVTQYRCH